MVECFSEIAATKAPNRRCSCKLVRLPLRIRARVSDKNVAKLMIYIFVIEGYS